MNHTRGVLRSNDHHPWSYSHIKNFETCPKRYYHTQVAKDFPDLQTKALDDGNELHDAFNTYIRKGSPLPPGLALHQPLLDKIKSQGPTYGEQKLAINREFKPVAYFAQDVWLRTIIDATVVKTPTAFIFDWKTGKPADDATQLSLSAACIFASMPAIDTVVSAFVFVNHPQGQGDLPGVITERFARADLPDIWNDVLPRVEELQAARRNAHFPPTPSYLCKSFCPVSICPHNGKAFR